MSIPRPPTQPVPRRRSPATRRRVRPLLTLGVTVTPTDRVFEVTGDLDMSTADLLVDFVELFGVHPAGRVRLDLSRVTFFSAHGISALLRVRNLVTAAGGRLTVCDPAPCVGRLLALTGVDQVLGYAG